MVEKRRCINCMAEMPAEGERCLVCGFDNQHVEQPEYTLPYNSVLKGRYLIGKILGQGGFGLTYIAWDQVLKVKVVVKEYFPMGMVTRGTGMSTAVLWNTSQASEAQRQRGYNSFIKEAQKMARVDQISSIVRVRDTFLENETAYIIMDYVEGNTLKEMLLKNGPMTFSQCMELLKPMMEGLSKVHNQGIIHRDISPDNIMIQPDGSVKLLDLGAAKDMTDVGGQKSQLVAKNGFSPLEQYIDNGKIGGWTDVYALCATIYYCIVGKRIPAALERMDNEEIDFPDTLKEPLPEHIKQALKDGLTLKPENRIQSVEELLTRLDIKQPKEDSAVVSKPKKIKNRKKRILRSVGIILLVCIVGFFALASLGSAGRKAQHLGNSNANMENKGGYAVIDKKYLYYTGADDGLYISSYNLESNSFETDEAAKICDYGKYINVGKDHIYFEGKEEGKSVIYQMNFDGTGLKVICSNEEQKSYDRPQYVEFVSGREYIYYMLEKEQGGSLKELYRYDLSEEKTELLMDKNISWFNVYDDAIYIIALENQNNILMSSNLNGISWEVLDDENMYETGFVEDEMMFLYSLKKEELIVCNPDGKETNSQGNLCAGANLNNAWGYGDGWFYYTDKENGNLHRVSKDGTDDSIVMKDHIAENICYANDSLWIMEAAYHRLYMAKNDGDNLVNISGSIKDLELEIAAEEDFTYEEGENGGVVITGYKGTLTEFKIPDQIGGKPVTEIGDDAFVNRKMVKIGLPEGLVKIGNRAFYYCKDLEYISFPESIKEIGYYAFSDTNLTFIPIPANVETIGYGAFISSKNAGTNTEMTEFDVSEENVFYTVIDDVLFKKLEDGTLCLTAYPCGKSETSYAIPEEVTEIQAFAIARTNLEEIEIPSSVKKIGNYAFYQTSKLKNIKISGECELPSAYGTALRVDFLDMDLADVSDFTYTENESGDGIVITGYTGALTKFSVPSQIDGKPVKEIGIEAFKNGKAVKIYLPDGLEKINEQAFRECYNLEFISFPDSLKEIGNYAFLNTNLVSVSIPSNLETIGYGVFLLRNDGQENDKFKNFEVSEENSSFKEVSGVLCEVLESGKLRMISYPQGRTDDTYTIPEDIVELWYFCFGRSKLSSVEIPSSIRQIDQYAFATCNALDSIAVSQNCEVDEDQGDDMNLQINRY